MLSPPLPKSSKAPRTSARLAKSDLYLPSSPNTRDSEITTDPSPPLSAASNVPEASSSRLSLGPPAPSSDQDVVMRDDERLVEKLVGPEVSVSEALAAFPSQMSIKDQGEEGGQLQLPPPPRSQHSADALDIMDVDTKVDDGQGSGEQPVTSTTVALAGAAEHGDDTPDQEPTLLPPDGNPEALTDEFPKYVSPYVFSINRLILARVRTTIFLFDSLNGVHRTPPRILAKYLVDEAADKKKVVITGTGHHVGKTVKVIRI